jgi:acetyl esterase/lipase
MKANSALFIVPLTTLNWVLGAYSFIVDQENMPNAMAAPPKPLRVPYKTVKKVDIPTDIYVPSLELAHQKNRTKTPVLIMIHGGGFMLGHSRMNNMDQIQDSVERGWIVLALDHRLCPGVNLLEGGMADVRDALDWAQNGGLKKELAKAGVALEPDPDRVMSMGTSAGGHLALSLAWGVPKPPLAILNFYGAVNFKDPFWTSKLASMPVLPPMPSDEMVTKLYAQKELFIGGASLEGFTAAAPQNVDDVALQNARQAFSINMIGSGNIFKAIWPSAPAGLEQIDPVLNVNAKWPPVGIVHGTADTTIPMSISSRPLEAQLQKFGVQHTFIPVPGQQHTFAGMMVKGSETWNIQRTGFDWIEKILEKSYA